MIITPYSSSSERATGGKWAPTADNFPCCKLYFPCDETSGTTLTDAINGSTVTTSAAVTGSAGLLTIASGGGVAQTDLGIEIAVGAKSALLMAVLNSAALANLILSDSSGASGNLMALDTTSSNRVSDGTNTANGGNMTAGSMRASCILFTPGTTGEGQKIECTSTTYTASAAANAAPGDLATLGTLTDLVINSVAASSVYGGIGFFVFDSTPSASLLQSMIAWHTWAWANNVKTIYPGLRGVA